MVVSFLLITATVARADYLFKSLDARTGLTSSQINCITKDAKGFMWMGTPAGLYRFDGYVFRHFQSDSQDGTSLPDSYIIDIQNWDTDGSLWVETPLGACIYHPQTESFERELSQVFAQMGIKEVPQIVHRDRFDRIWCYLSKQKKVVCFDTETQMLYGFNDKDDANKAGLNGNVCSINGSSDGVIVTYDNGLLVCLSVSPQPHTVWANNDIAQRKLRKQPGLKTFTDSRNNIWLYGPGTLFYYSKSSKTWDTNIGSQMGLHDGVDFGVNEMAGDRRGNIWLATNLRGIVKMDVETHAFEEVVPEISALSPGLIRYSRSQVRTVNSVYVDDTDLLWVGTARSGIAFWGENIFKFSTKLSGDVTAIAQDGSGKVWYGTSENGLLDYSGVLASQKVTALETTADGSIWVGSAQNGLTRIRDGKSTLYSKDSENGQTALIDNHINALCKDKRGCLWIATNGGIQMYNPQMNTFSSYTKDRNKLQTNTITSLACSNNKVYIGMSEGLSIMNTSGNNKLEYYTGNKANTQRFTNNYVTQVFVDSRDLIWIGTREGINVLNPENDALEYITERTGLCNNNICGITEDKHRNIWVTTGNGVCRIVLQPDHENGRFNYGLYNYFQSDGLQSNEFNNGAIFCTAEGDVMLGGISGISYVKQKQQSEKEMLPPVIFSQLFIGEEEINTGEMFNGHVVLKQSLCTSTKITLANDENTFTIKFSAGNYNQGERLQFMYMLEGSGNLDWINANSLIHGVTFENLKPKTYKLQVKAVSADGNSSSKVSTLEIEVESPWWSKWWMILIYIAIATAILYMWKRGIDQLREIWRKKKSILADLARQREEIKATSDDLRQPMSRMASIIMTLAERDSTLEEREQLNSLHSQMLQVITRVSDMQAALEHPEENARQNTRNHYQLDANGQMALPGVVNDELTYEIGGQQDEAPMTQFQVFFIDDNDEFLKYMAMHLRRIYVFRAYNSMRDALKDIESNVPDLVVCKQNMPDMTGSELCNKIKMNANLFKIKFILVTDSKLNSNDMMNQDITMSADDYISKPFNLQEAVMRFNKVLGIGSMQIASNLIEGAETRMLEDRNSSMTTATESIDYGAITEDFANDDDDQIRAVTIRLKREQDQDAFGGDLISGNDYGGGLSMSDMMDKRLLASIEQYVQQNMSRGQINLDEMATAMGMAMRPFFQKVKDLTGKTPAEVVRDVRLKHACILLKRTNINTSELASNVGFATGEHLINLFKERFGMTPTEYRQKYRK